MRVNTRLQTCLVFLGLLFALGARAAVQVDRIVAVVNDDVIMESELNDKLRTVKEQLRQQGTTPPPSTVLKRQVLDRLILNKLQLQMAEHTGIRVDDETLNRTISNIAAENQVNLDEFRKILEQDGYSYARFREDIRHEIMISRLQQRAVVNRVIVSEREVDNYLANQAHQGVTELEYHLAHILIAMPSSPSAKQLEETRNKAQMVLEKLKSGADFKDVAAQYSDGQQALDGGDLGWRKASQVPTLFADFVADMHKGDISDLIRSPSGYHIIKLLNVRDSKKVVITQTHARHILIKTDELTSDEDAVRRLKQLKFRIEGGADFGELARANSTDAVSAADGGDLGWVSPGDLVPQFEQVMNSLKPGEISEPFRTRYGWHIVQVLGRRKHDSTDDIRRARAREAIRKRKVEEAKENWLRELRDDAYVEYRLDS
jgi:peptidyl-prolyl cis-trans isomerase SurA